MRILLAPDSFKECLRAGDVCAALHRGIADAFPHAHIQSLPMADGGEGTLAVLADALGGRRVNRRVTGPLGAPVDASFLHLPDTALAVIEAAEACGLELIPTDMRDPRRTATDGVGELFAAALERHVKHVIISVGGSGTVDGGTGLARALGYRFLTADGTDLPPGGGALNELAAIAPPARRPWDRVAVTVAVDVDNPLLGKHGAARVFAPQKGAAPDVVEQLERGLMRLADIVDTDLGLDVRHASGGGAAGGLAAGLTAFTGANVRPGIEVIMDAVRFDRRLREVDLVITGEGRTDAQTLNGKVCAGIARRAAAMDVPCVVISGSVTAPVAALRAGGVTAAFSALQRPCSLAEAIANAPAALAATAAHAVGLWAAAAERQT